MGNDGLKKFRSAHSVDVEHKYVILRRHRDPNRLENTHRSVSDLINGTS